MILTPTTSARRVAARALLLGAATGSRSSLGLGAPVLADWRARRKAGTGSWARASGAVAALSGVVGELVGDKLPSAPSRLEPPSPQIRAGSGATGSVLLSRHASANPLVPALAGALGAAAGTYAGAAWRGWAVDRVPDWQAAVVEDVVALLLARAAVRGW